MKPWLGILYACKCIGHQAYGEEPCAALLYQFVFSSQCKDSYLTPESLNSAIGEGSTELELRTLQYKIQGEIKKLQKTGVTG